MAGRLDLDAVVRAAQEGDESAFAVLVDRFRPELELHGYRMLGSYEDARDVTQDVLLSAWQSLAGFKHRSSIRTWLYRIATRACLARHTRDERRRTILARTSDPDGVVMPLAVSVPWLQPLPEQVLDQVVAREPEPGAAATSRETVEIVFVAALQHLSGTQRASLVLRDVLGWPAARCAAALGTSPGQVDSAVRRARAAVRDLLGDERENWPAPAGDAAELAVVRQYVDAVERADDAAIAALLHADVVVSHQPGAGGPDSTEPGWYAGRTRVVEAWAPALHGPQPLDMRLEAVRVNGGPAVVSTIRVPGTQERRIFGLSVLTIRGGLVTEVVNLHPVLVERLGLVPS